MTAYWHNVRVTRRDPITGKLEVSSDFERSIEDAVENAFFHGLPVVNVVKVEFCGPSIATFFDRTTHKLVKAWSDVTEDYKLEFHRRQYAS